jgi:hypothetical protein
MLKFSLFSKSYEGVSKSFRTNHLERELQMVQLSAIRCSCIAILWVSIVSFAAITLCVASQRVLIFVVYFVINSIRKLSDTPSCLGPHNVIWPNTQLQCQTGKKWKHRISRSFCTGWESSVWLLKMSAKTFPENARSIDSVYKYCKWLNTHTLRWSGKYHSIQKLKNVSLLYQLLNFCVGLRLVLLILNFALQFLDYPRSLNAVKLYSCTSLSVCTHDYPSLSPPLSFPRQLHALV